MVARVQSYVESCIPKESCRNELNTVEEVHYVRDLYSPSGSVGSVAKAR